MRCPFCAAAMVTTDGNYVCPGGGPLLAGTRCPCEGRPLSEADILRIEIGLIDAEAE